MIEKFDDVRFLKHHKEKSTETLKVPDIDILKTLWFNDDTKWEDNSLPQQILDYGKTPPLQVKEIHGKGIDGKGVNVAIIDQPLALDHPEYKGKIAKYEVFAPEGYSMPISSMHGPAVTSLLAGENIGTAPGVNVYYAAVPMWLGDAQYEVEALKWIMKINNELDKDEKIKFVSVSAAPGSKELRPKNNEMWLEAVKEAEKSGLCVVDCTEGHRFVSAGYVDYESKQFKYGFPNLQMNKHQNGEVHVPNSLRTVAESYDNRNFSYTYNGVGGLSWGIPYAVGILCLAQQENPALSANQLKKLMIESASKNNGVINPKEFLKLAKTKSTEKCKDY